MAWMGPSVHSALTAQGLGALDFRSNAHALPYVTTFLPQNRHAALSLILLASASSPACSAFFFLC
ncbi:uncharacterized protein BO96DRAFT_416790 [Aspergillus niger CBS 101883]|uniref:uncharacterized protein n=1 Tax=Aspergillus lacticoffeatus (strain CBS 101883) TaxID=1450533 RepID=UPI000D7F7EDF|nr:uncharacterized protein BO96DRAFT_416790 [Aspergillus niger CBS 101883]PYH50790.1 hypothetical protein BO96DRAFT_416790 [Aspergillus niger CBS 101883]